MFLCFFLYDFSAKIENVFTAKLSQNMYKTLAHSSFLVHTRSNNARKEVLTMKPLISDNEQRFRNWLRNQLDANKIRRFTDNSIIAYSHALRSNGNRLIPFSKDNLFSYTKYDEFCDIYDKIMESPDFDEVNAESGNGALEIALKSK